MGMVYHFAGLSGKVPDEEKARSAAEKDFKAATTALTKEARDSGLLDREFDQFGQNAFKTVLKEMSAAVPTWIDAALHQVTPKIAKARLASHGIPNVSKTVAALKPLLRDFAMLDGYNVWRKTHKSERREGKLTAVPDGDEPQRRPAVQSWIVPVRQWAELESWGEDPKTKQPIEKPTHRNGLPDPNYLVWLADTLRIFDEVGTVKSEHIDRLHPDCLEALDFNLSAGRHKPFTFDPGQHRPPAELITELQGLHSEIQQRLGKLLSMVGGGK